jgi:membrane protein
MVASVRNRVSEVDINPFDDPSATQYPVGFFATAKLVFKRFGRHNVTVIAAGIAFYALLALLPTLIAMTSLYSLVNDPQEILDQVNEAADNLGGETGDLVRKFGESAVGAEGGVAPDREAFSVGGLVTVIVGVLIALFSASGATQKLMNIVNSAYEAHESRSGLALRGLAYLFTALGILFVVVLIGLLGVIPAVAAAADLSGPFETLVNIGTYLGLALLFPAFLTLVYRYSPDRVKRTPWKNKGAFVAMVMWVLFAIAFSFYARNIGSFGAAYALLGGIAGIIIFFQLTAISIIVGAEVNAVLEDPANAKVPVKVVTPAHAVVPLTAPIDRINAASRPLSKKAVPVPKEPISLGKALAGVAALFFLGRNT